ARSTGGAASIVGSAVLDVDEAADRRFDGVTRSHGRQGRCGLGYEQQGCRKRNQDPGRHRCPSYMTLRRAWLTADRGYPEERPRKLRMERGKPRSFRRGGV